jgi:hypothetical protein
LSEDGLDFCDGLLAESGALFEEAEEFVGAAEETLDGDHAAWGGGEVRNF